MALQCRPPGAITAYLNKVIMGADVDAEPLEWERTSVWVDGERSGILALRKRIKAGP